MTVAFYLSAGRIIMLFSFLSFTWACRSFLVMFGFGNLADFITPATCALNWFALSMGKERYSCSVATTKSSTGSLSVVTA